MFSFEKRASSVHGDGLFATRTIKAGETICYYEGERIDRKEADKMSAAESVYLVNVSETQSLKGYHPARSALGMAQYINDSVSLHQYLKREETDFRCGVDAIFKYYFASHKGSNVVFNNRKGKLIVSALYDIKAGDELFVCYTHDYWLYQLLGDKKSWSEYFLKAEAGFAAVLTIFGETDQTQILELRRQMTQAWKGNNDKMEHVFTGHILIGAFIRYSQSRERLRIDWDESNKDLSTISYQ